MNSKDDQEQSASGEQSRAGDDAAADRRFNETVRNLLNTPPKPHKGGKPARKEGSQRKVPGGARRAK